MGEGNILNFNGLGSLQDAYDKMYDREIARTKENANLVLQGFGVSGEPSTNFGEQEERPAGMYTQPSRFNSENMAGYAPNESLAYEPSSQGPFNRSSGVGLGSMEAEGAIENDGEVSPQSENDDAAVIAQEIESKVTSSTDPLQLEQRIAMMYDMFDRYASSDPAKALDTMSGFNEGYRSRLSAGPLLRMNNHYTQNFGE